MQISASIQPGTDLPKFERPTPTPDPRPPTARLNDIYGDDTPRRRGSKAEVGPLASPAARGDEHQPPYPECGSQRTPHTPTASNPYCQTKAQINYHARTLEPIHKLFAWPGFGFIYWSAMPYWFSKKCFHSGDLDKYVHFNMRN